MTIYNLKVVRYYFCISLGNKLFIGKIYFKFYEHNLLKSVPQNDFYVFLHIIQDNIFFARNPI